VDRVLPLGLVERELKALSVEFVGTVLDPVRPGGEQLAAPGGAHLFDAVAVEDRPPGHGVTAQPAADADDHGPLLAERKLHLLARRADRRLHGSEDRLDTARSLHPHRTMWLRSPLPSFEPA
jgi:hypothetical protein